jgi:HEAT repeat protein
MSSLGRTAIEALGKFGAAAVPALVEALKDPEPSVRKSAASALGGSAALMEALKDQDVYVRISVRAALEKIESGPKRPLTRPCRRERAM